MYTKQIHGRFLIHDSWPFLIVILYEVITYIIEKTSIME